MHNLTINPETVFQALSDNTRLRIIHLLVSGGQECCLCELVDVLQEPQYKLSRHLKILRQAGLLSSQKEGRWVYHQLIQEPDYLQQLYTTVSSLPDTDSIFSMDAERFDSRMALRENGRCKTDIFSNNLKLEVK